MKNIPIPRIHTYKELSHRINQIDIGELSDVRETLCIGIDDECKFSRRYRDLLQPLLKMAQFYLSANNKRDKLNWFGKQEGSFKVAISRDGAPFHKDDQALAQLVSFLNCGRRVCSSAAKILLFGANWRLWTCLQICGNAKSSNEKNRRKLYSIQVDGKEKIVSFQFKLPPNDMKYMAFLVGELSISCMLPFSICRYQKGRCQQSSRKFWLKTWKHMASMEVGWKSKSSCCCWKEESRAAQVNT